MGALKIFETPWLCPWLLLPIFYGLLLWLALWMSVQNLKSVALPVPEIIWGTKKIWAVLDSLDMPKNFNGFSSDASYACTCHIWSPLLTSFTCSWLNGGGGYPLAKKLVRSLAMPTLSTPFPQIKSYAYRTDYLFLCTRFPAILDCSFQWELRTPNLGEGDRP